MDFSAVPTYSTPSVSRASPDLWLRAIIFPAHRSFELLSSLADAPVLPAIFIPRVTLIAFVHPGLIIFDTLSVSRAYRVSGLPIPFPGLHLGLAEKLKFYLEDLGEVVCL